jgi:hypothetical protein
MTTLENIGTRESNGQGVSIVTVELRGLSTDPKPVTWEGCLIRNGSVYIEIDTGKLCLFSAEGQQWNEV